MACLTVSDLSVDFMTSCGRVHAIRNVSLSLCEGKITALVGESGSGKSVTSLAIMGLLPPNGIICSGSIWYQDHDLLQMKKRARRKLNGTSIGMIFQDPISALDPLFSIGDQITEGLIHRRGLAKEEARRMAIASMEALRLPEPEYLMERRPFELSGGMCQRVMIAIAMSLKPSVLIADEPTTALDVTVQKQIMEQLHQLACENQIAVLLITHDLGVVAEIADDVYIMRQGEIVEHNDVYTIFQTPAHAYTKKLMDSII